jgi:UDP-2,4-diacetamido-2,4,6-trideoxy-beta-L-altropyranose hydrolase
LYSVAIRVDGSSNIGMGHIIRCISLAGEFKKKGNNVFFLSMHEEGIQKLIEEGYEVLRLKKNENRFYELSANEDEFGLADELSEINGFISQKPVDILVVDSYHVDYNYLQELRDKCRLLVYIDDINSFVYPVDILINGNITGEYMGYSRNSSEEILLLGPQYNMIRSEFKNLPSRIVNREIKEMLVTTGGSDPCGMSIKIIKAMLSDTLFKNIRINLVIGAGFKEKDKIHKEIYEFDNIHLYENVRRMSEVILRSDLAISAGGSTLYELCACGTPAIAFILADNQAMIVEKLEELGYIFSLGWYYQFSDKELLSAIKKMYFDYEARAAYSKRMQKLVDGNGVKRIVNCISSMVRKTGG